MDKTNPFAHVELSQHQKDQITSARMLFDTVYSAICEIPEGRERSIAITKLEETAMWVNKAISRGIQEG